MKEIVVRNRDKPSSPRGDVLLNVGRGIPETIAAFNISVNGFTASRLNDLNPFKTPEGQMILGVIQRSGRSAYAAILMT